MGNDVRKTTGEALEIRRENLLASWTAHVMLSSEGAAAPSEAPYTSITQGE
jgi:hypothetical protein